MLRLGAATLSHPRWLALVLGAVAAAGFQPWALWPLTIVATALLIELVARARNGREAALIGWLFGWSHFTVGNNWIATAFTYQANMPHWLGGIAVMLLSLYLAVYPALTALAARLLAAWGNGRVGQASRFIGLVFIPCWIVTEWLRAWVFTGFAWNPLGVALLGGYRTPGLAALAPYLGTYGLSGLLVAIAAGLRRLAKAWQAGSRAAGGAVLAGAALLALVMHLPALWLPDRGGSLPYTLVQPDIRQDVLNDAHFYEDSFARMARLSLPSRPGQHRLVLWPESGLPDYLRDGYPQRYYDAMTHGADPRTARERIARVVGARGMVLTGAVDLVIRDGRAVAARNSVLALDDAGDIVAGYAKAHLVPYGEYLALRWLLEPLGATRLVPGALDFWPGPGPRTIDLGQWGRAGIQVCYEITFSGQVVERQHRPDYLFNPSNDGWFGSWGPPQHLAQARLRAIEEGLPVLRSTTTGISAVISPDGIVRQHVPRLTAGRLDGTIPYPAPPTPFALLGNALPLGWAGLLLAISLVAMRRARH